MKKWHLWSYKAKQILYQPKSTSDMRLEHWFHKGRVIGSQTRLQFLSFLSSFSSGVLWSVHPVGQIPRLRNPIASGYLHLNLSEITKISSRLQLFRTEIQEQNYEKMTHFSVNRGGLACDASGPPHHYSLLFHFTRLLAFHLRNEGNELFLQRHWGNERFRV